MSQVHIRSKINQSIAKETWSRNHDRSQEMMLPTLMYSHFGPVPQNDVLHLDRDIKRTVRRGWCAVRACVAPAKFFLFGVDTRQSQSPIRKWTYCSIICARFTRAYPCSPCMKDRDPSDARAPMQSNSSLAWACFTVDACLRHAGLNERDDDNLLLIWMRRICQSFVWRWIQSEHIPPLVSTDRHLSLTQTRETGG